MFVAIVINVQLALSWSGNVCSWFMRVVAERGSKYGDFDTFVVHAQAWGKHPNDVQDRYRRGNSTTMN